MNELKETQGDLLAGLVELGLLGAVREGQDIECKSGEPVRVGWGNICCSKSKVEIIQQFQFLLPSTLHILKLFFVCLLIIFVQNIL